MKLYIQAKLISSELAKSFKDENGEDVVYTENVIKSDNGDILVLNSQENYEQFEGETGIVEVKTRAVNGQRPNVVKLSMAGFRAGEKIAIDEEVID